MGKFWEKNLLFLTSFFLSESQDVWWMQTICLRRQPWDGQRPSKSPNHKTNLIFLTLLRWEFIKENKKSKIEKALSTKKAIKKEKESFRFFFQFDFQPLLKIVSFVESTKLNISKKWGLIFSSNLRFHLSFPSFYFLDPYCFFSHLLS